MWSSLSVFGKDALDVTSKTLKKPVDYIAEKSNFFGGIMESIPTEGIKSQWESIHTSFSGVFDKVFEEDDINLDPQDLPCAYISDRVYLNPFERPRHIFGYELDEKFNEFEYALYVNHALKTRIIGYRGTEFTEVKDYISDLHIVFGTQSWNDRFNVSVHVYEEAKKLYPDYKARVTGHSLGGTIAYFIAKKFLPDRCTVFNPGSSANPTFAQLIADTQLQADRTRHVFTYRISGDVVSALSVIGYTRTFRKRAINPKALHAIANYCALPDTSKEVF
ncbi:hypothetical protein KBC03_04930 [Patescibacteria group bacterium]|nr:hypothetical protein [Patescibacteria group bacterium]